MLLHTGILVQWISISYPQLVQGCTSQEGSTRIRKGVKHPFTASLLCYLLNFLSSLYVLVEQTSYVRKICEKNLSLSTDPAGLAKKRPPTAKIDLKRLFFDRTYACIDPR